jgi:hypothetical protein
MSKPQRFNLTKEERKISLSNIFGKVATAVCLTGTAAIAVGLGGLIAGAVDTSQAATFNPADYMYPILGVFGVSMVGGLSGMYLGRRKHKLSKEFNYQVRKEFANMGFELVEEEGVDFSAQDKPKEKWVRRDQYYGGYDHVVVHRPHHDRFFEGLWLGSLLNGSSSSHSSGGGRSSSSGGNSNNGQAMLVFFAIAATAIALSAAAYVSYKSFRLNFMDKPEDLLTGPEVDVFGLDDAGKASAPTMG